MILNGRHRHHCKYQRLYGLINNPLTRSSRVVSIPEPFRAPCSLVATFRPRCLHPTVRKPIRAREPTVSFNGPRKRRCPYRALADSCVVKGRAEFFADRAQTDPTRQPCRRTPRETCLAGNKIRERRLEGGIMVF